jgi:hypothetical protein
MKFIAVKIPVPTFNKPKFMQARAAKRASRLALEEDENLCDLASLLAIKLTETFIITARNPKISKKHLDVVDPSLTG